MKGAAVIPVLDERDALAAVLAAIPRAVCPDVIVVDGGSRDGTREVARASGARVVEDRRGYGGAMLRGAACALEAGAEVVAFLDGNGTIDGGQMARLLGPIASGEADVVLGCRAGGAPRLHQRLGNRLAAAVLRAATGARVSDVPPARAVSVAALGRLALRETGYGWPLELVARAARLGLRIVEVPIECRPRRSRSKVSGTLRGSISASLAFLRILASTVVDALREAPAR